MAENFVVKRQNDSNFEPRAKEQSANAFDSRSKNTQTSPDYTGKPNPSGTLSSASFGSHSQSSSGGRSGNSSGSQHDRIARRAYELWEQRGRQHGHEMEDWLRAERELKRA